VYKSIDGGNIWSVQGLADEAIFSLEINPDSEHVIYAGCESGKVFKSTDSGNNWMRIDPGWSPAMITDILIDPSSTNDIYIGRDASDWHTGVHGGVALSTDGGSSWTEVDSGLTTTHTIRLAIDTISNTLYAATYGGGVFSYTFSTGVEEEQSAYSDLRIAGLLQIYPNPFTKQTRIGWQLTPVRSAPTEIFLQLRIYDATGRLVRQYDRSIIELFDHIIWDATDNFGKELPTSIYFCELKVGNWRTVKKMILLR